MPGGRFKGRFRGWATALAAGALLAVLPVTAAGAQAAGKPDVPTPTVPTALGIRASGGLVCSTDQAAPTVVGDPSPQLSATVHAAAGSTQPQHLRAHFDIQARQAPGKWTAAAAELQPAAPASATDGQVVTTLVTDPLATDTLYRLAASTWSFTSDGTRHVASPRTSAAGGWCYFTVDPTGPLAPTVTIGAPYTACTADDCVAHGGPGVPGSFTFAPGAGDTGVVGYDYQLGFAAPTSVPGSPATVTLTPQNEGLVTLKVRAQDATGRSGAWTQVSFKVAPPASSVGRWHFSDGQPGDTSTAAADTATGPGDRHAAALSGTGADWTALGRGGSIDGVSDEALTLDGSSGHATTDGQVIDPASSFAVSAWAFPADLAQDRTALSQTGTDGSGFALGYSEADQAWRFSYAWTDGSGARQVAYAVAPAGGERVWTQLAGSYDSAAHTLTLYVNGLPQGTPTALPATAAAQPASGDLEFGRNTVAGSPGTYGGYWHGYLDEVQVWQRTLSADDALEDARLSEPDRAWFDVAHVAAWNATGASGTTVADTTTGYGRTLTTEGGAQLDGSTLVLDGVDDAASTPGPVVDSSGSFTVSAVVQPDMSVVADKPDGWTAQVAGQRSADGSAWGVWFQLAGHDQFPDDDGNLVSVPATRWLAGRIDADGTFTGAQSNVTVWAPGTAATPVQVTGVFDAQDGTASVYIGDNDESTMPFAPVAGVGDLTVGKAYLGGSWGSYFPGRVSSLDLWTGAVDNSNQLAILIGG
jgi:hypothetical protein